MHIPFSKYHGAGNDFIIIADFSEQFLLTQSHIQKLCKRQTGIGADGLIFVRYADKADFSMSYFNADGSYAALCGNGLRCTGQYLVDQQIGKPSFSIEIGNRILTVKQIREKIFTFLPKPEVKHWALHDQEQLLYVVDSGVPHAVLFYEGEINIMELGQRLRFSPLFYPEGVNVNFVRIVDKKNLEVRTYERGVEQETLSCGTGAVASVFVAHQLGYCYEHVFVHPLSKECLEIQLGEEVAVTGPVKKVFEGQIVLD